MAKPTAWMPIYWGDYLRDTSHLTAEQHGMYLLLIAHYWSTGKALPADDRKLAKMARVNGTRWKLSKSTISEFFKLENGAWHHPRIERELIEAFNRKDAAIARGKRGAEVRWNDRASMLGPSVKHSNHSHSHIKTHESDSESLTGAARDPARNGGSGPRARRTETTKERVADLAAIARAKLLRSAK